MENGLERATRNLSFLHVPPLVTDFKNAVVDALESISKFHWDAINEENQEEARHLRDTVESQRERIHSLESRLEALESQVRPRGTLGP